jgi:hypothetical protein
LARHVSLFAGANKLLSQFQFTLPSSVATFPKRYCNLAEKWHKGDMAEQDYDFHTFVASVALRDGKTFHVQCNCGGTAPITPPLKTEFVVCPKCTAKIRVMVMEGDPGYMLGRDPSGKDFLFTAQGSSAKPVHELSQPEQESIIAKMKSQAKATREDVRMKFTKNLQENPSNFPEIVKLVKGKTITSLADMGTSFELGLSDDYMLRVNRDRVNIVRTKNPPQDI